MQFIQDRPFAGGSRDARTSGSSVGGPDTLAGLAEVQRGARTLPDLMSVPGQSRRLDTVPGMSTFPPTPDLSLQRGGTTRGPEGDVVRCAARVVFVYELPAGDF